MVLSACGGSKSSGGSDAAIGSDAATGSDAVADAAADAFAGCLSDLDCTNATPICNSSTHMCTADKASGESCLDPRTLIVPAGQSVMFQVDTSSINGGTSDQESGRCNTTVGN